MFNSLKRTFSDTFANEMVVPKIIEAVAMDRQFQIKSMMQAPRETFIPQRITYDLIRQTIVTIRVDEMIGKGKWTKDETLAEKLFCLIKHFNPKSPLTYERIMQAITFVKSNELMGAGKWTKEDHLAEYLFALVQLSEAGGNMIAGAAMEAMEMPRATAANIRARTQANALPGMGVQQ